jgi:uncharacterized protein
VNLKYWGKILSMASYKRKLDLPKDAHFFLFGPRQTGKSTLLRLSFNPENTKFYNLLSNKEYIRLSSDPSLLSAEVRVLKSDLKYIVIDEIQKIPALLDEVHLLIEELGENKKFILSGSSARKLKRGGANMLGGRAWQRNLYPLTYQELGYEFDLNKVLNYGSLPAVYSSDKEASVEILDSYVSTYIAEEIKAEALVRNIGAFMNFLKLAGAESGEILNFNNIAQEINISSNTVKEYYQILEDTLIGKFLLPYSNSQRKKLAKSPKFYFFDNGVKHAIQSLTGIELESGNKLYGTAFEHFIINQIFCLSDYYKRKFDFSFYRSYDNVEVDLIIKTPLGKILAIEIKSSENPRGFLTGLRSFQKLEASAELLCISRVLNYREENGVKLFPWREGLEYILQLK